jgi:hypothetical protein
MIAASAKALGKTSSVARAPLATDREHTKMNERKTVLLDLDAIEARAVAASVGPWTHEIDGHHFPVPSGIVYDADTTFVANMEHYATDASDTRELRIADGVFIAEARSDVPALVAEVRRLRIELEESKRETRTVTRAVARIIKS